MAATQRTVILSESSERRIPVFDAGNAEILRGVYPELLRFAKSLP